MGNTTIYPDVATELIEIFKFVDEPVLEKIPEKLKEELERISNKEHEFKIDKTKSLSEQKMLPQTKELLSGIFIKYCCREEDGNEILVACKENDVRAEEEKREKYNPDRIFETRKENKDEVVEVVKPEEKKQDCFKLVVVENLPWYKKIARSVSRFFKRFF